MAQHILRESDRPIFQCQVQPRAINMGVAHVIDAGRIEPDAPQAQEQLFSRVRGVLRLLGHGLCLGDRSLDHRKGSGGENYSTSDPQPQVSRYHRHFSCSFARC